MGDVFAYVGAAVVIAWGVAHAAPTSTVLAGFHLTDRDNRLVLVMEWLAEAVTLVFTGTLVVLVTAYGTGPTVDLVWRTVTAALLVMAALHSLLGARTSILPMRICPAVLTVSAGLILTASLV